MEKWTHLHDVTLNFWHSTKERTADIQQFHRANIHWKETYYSFRALECLLLHNSLSSPCRSSYNYRPEFELYKNPGNNP